MKKIRLFIICCTVFLLTGCIDSGLGEENEDRANVNQNYLNYKQDIYCEWGKESAFYQDRIYYFQSGDEPGIYSMDTRGKDKRLEIYVENIRKLQVRDDGIYYASQKGENYPRRYTIYRKEWEGIKAQEYFDTYPDFTYSEGNVWDFFINEDDSMVVVDIYYEIPQMNVTFQIFTANAEKEPVILSEYSTYLEDYTLEGGKIDAVNLFGYDNLLVMSQTGLEWRLEYQEISPPKQYAIDMGESNVTIFDEKRNETVFFRNYAIHNENSMDGILQTIYEESFVISDGSCIFWVPKNGHGIVQKLELSTDVRYSVLDGNDLLVITDKDKKQEYIYRISLETAEIKEVSAIEEGQKVLAVYKDMLYTVSDDALYVYEYGKRGYEEKEHIEWKEKLKKTSKIEMSGNIVFVYDVDEQRADFILKEYQILDM